MVKRITDTAYKERQENASMRRTKKPTNHTAKINLGQSRIAPRDPYIILTDNNYNTRQTRSRHKTIQHYQPTVQCTNLSSMHMLGASTSNIGIRYNTIPEKNYPDNLEPNSNSIPLITRKSEGGKQKETMLEALLKAPMSSNMGDVLTDCSQDDMIDCVGLDDDDVMPTRESNNTKSQWITGTVSDNNFMDSQQNLNQPNGSIESGSSLSTGQVSNAKTFEVNFKIPRTIKNNKRLFSSRQMQKDKGSAAIKKFKPRDYDNSSQDILKNSQNIAKELGLQLDHVNTNLFSEDYTSPLNQNSDNSNTFIHGGGISDLNDPGLSSCYLSNYNASSNGENYHNYPDDEGFFSHNLGGDIDHINPPLTTIDHSNVHTQNMEQNNYNLFNYDSLTQSEELFDMLESENENNSSFASNNYSSNICNQNRNNDNIMDMDIDYDENGFNPLSGGSIVISQHSIKSLKRETLSQESNDSRNDAKISCSIKSSASAVQGLPTDQIIQENLGQYDDFMLNNAVTQNDSLSFSTDLPIVESFTSLNPDHNNMSLARIQERSSGLGMMDEDIPIADDRETSQPAAQATDLMNFYRKYGRWEEPYKPMKGTATAMLCFLCNWFGMVANFDDHLRKMKNI